MAGNLEDALKSLLTAALPGLLGGTPPAVSLAVAGDLLTLDPESADAAAAAPRPDDRADRFPLAAPPAGPYTLTQPPYPGPRRVRLVTAAGDLLPLREDEVAWDASDSRVFSLNPRPDRDLAGVASVEALYGVTAVFSKIKALQTLRIQLDAADPQKLEQAQALVVAVVELNRQALVDAAQASYADGDYSAQVAVKSLELVQAARQAGGGRVLSLNAALELKAARALREDEGAPIKHILSPGQPVSAQRPVNIAIVVEG